MSWLKAIFCILASCFVLEYFSIVAGLLLLLISILWFTLKQDRKTLAAFLQNLVVVVPLGFLHYFGFVSFLLAFVASVLIALLIALKCSESPASKA